jgi:hypothetical protein
MSAALLFYGMGKKIGALNVLSCIPPIFLEC